MSDPKRPTPDSSRPNIPYDLLDSAEGMGLFPWSRVSEKMLSAHIYWIGTTCPDGRPHVMPVWGVLLDETFYFSTEPDTANGRNLAANPALVVHLDSGEDGSGESGDSGADCEGKHLELIHRSGHVLCGQSVLPERAPGSAGAGVVEVMEANHEESDQN